MDVPEDKLEQRRAIKMVTAADKYLQKHEYLNALNLYKESVDILPDPDIIYKIRKLRKYMKRKGYDLGENKENIDSCEPAANEIENSDENLIKKVKSPDILKEQSDFYCSSNSQNPPSNSHQMSAKSPLLDTDKQIVKKQNDKSPLTQSMEQLSLCSKQPVPVKAEDEVRVPLGDETNKASLADEVKRPPKKAVVEYDGPIRDFKDLRKYLYPHQKEGMKWLARLYSDGKGGILGDDMGLGKTLLMIGYLAKMFEVGEVETALVVVPSSLILPWHQEIDKWAPGLNYDSFHDKGKSGRKKTLQFIQRRGGVLLVTYGLLANNYEDLSTDRTGQEFVWDYMILDEGHKIKNPTKTQKAAHHIPSRNRIIMTGTPIQNNLVELWSLFNFVHHGTLLGTQKTFKMKYENPITRARQKDASLEEKQLGFMMTKNLQKLIAPFFLRRTKAELMSDSKSGIPKLPRKNDLIIWVKMTENQKQVYESYLCLDEVKQLMSSSKSPLVALIILKKLCDHLRLMSVRVCRSLGLLTKEESRKFRSSFHHLDDPDEIAEQTKEMNVLDQSSKHTSGSSTISSSEFNENACAATQLNGIPDTVLCQESGKLIVLIELLGYIVATNHKCVVFSQSAKMLDIIQKILNNLKYKYVRMDGKVIKLEERARIIRKFETDKSISIFLMTTQVGGVGLNLTVADRIIIVDPSWNPATDSQAVDRVYRIGQTKNVIIFRLMTCGSVEEKIYIRQLFKLSINRQTTKESKDPFRYFTKQDLKQLFIVENLAWSDTQQQLNEMFAGMRQSDEVVDQQIEFIESLNYVFGVSDHDLVFSKEDDNEEATLSNSRVETMMVQAEEAIRSEVNTDRSVSVKQWSSTSSTVNNERQMRDPDGQNFVSLLPLNPNGKVPTVPTTHTRPPFNRNDDDVVVVVVKDSDDDDDDFTSVSIGSNNNNSSSSRTGVNDLTTPSIDRWTMNYNKNSSSSTLGTISNPISVEDCCSDEQLSPTPIVHSSVPNTKSLSDSVCESPAPENNTTKTGSIGRKSSILHSDDLLKSFMCNNSANSSRQRPRLSDSVRKAEDTAVDSEDGTWFVADSDDENGTTTEMGRHTTLKPSLNFCVAESDSENDMINDSCADGSLSGKALNSTKGSSSKNFRTPSFKGVSSVVPSSSPRTEGREEEEMETVADNSFEGQTEQRLGHDQSKNTECNGEGNDSVVNVKRHRKVYCVISSSEEDSGSDGVDDDDNNENKRTNDDSSSFDAVLPKLSKCHRKRLLSSSESEAGTDSDGEGENNISVVQEMLNISTNPHESLISSVQVRPVKVRRSQQFNNSQTTQSPSLSSAARKGPFEAELSDADMEGASAVVKNNSLVARGAGGTSDGVGEREEDGNGKREENDVKEDEDSEEEEEEEGDDEQEEEEENEMDVINKERKEISVVREENEDSEEEEIELPFLSNEKSEEFNNFVRDARKSYLSENYKEALYSTLKALNLDSSDLKLQTFALKLRKLCKPQ